MGKLFMYYLSGTNIFSCGTCKVHLALFDQLISTDFQGRYGPAYLFGECVNVIVGESEDRNLTTGMHVVADIYCVRCDEHLGWKYEFAKDESQKNSNIVVFVYI
ncbi:yippee-like protein [Heterostelium album PN500]|uniref:Protein yippee-like n=1 Tax=Heterostelium pallidum (strain ATCC 26659 / Pp 5 / PN500) TaxID=670386 RepID=D3B0U5_HETP5|nr:yippee-like protein [Heterostelium album PN500]EFA84919.1 yippee-like protein [Heterostelium album PN500]|eukprot:XP_020437029.1 yippee-like protein [Heterostelium album PN500]